MENQIDRGSEAISSGREGARVSGNKLSYNPLEISAYVWGNADFGLLETSCLAQERLDRGSGQPCPYWRSFRRSVLRWMPRISAA